ncbi:MAG: glycosyltransferase [Bacilli bacterium]|nr:glycosyltransferase [Bacilli bacterium]
MKVLLYFENEKSIRKSGIGRALRHQIRACEMSGVEYTLNPKDSFDIAHINTYMFNSYRILRRCQKKGIPVIVHGHSTKEDFRDSFRCWKLMSIFYFWRLKKMYSHADYIVTPTEYSKGLIENYGYNKKVYAVSNGIDLKAYAPQPENAEIFRKYFNLSPEQKVVIGLGLQFKRKGIADFFEVARKMPDVKFIWFSHLAPILQSHFVRKAIKHRPSNAIMAGYVEDYKVVRGAFQNADAFFFPSYEENEGIVTLEALATKCPCVIRDIGVYKDWLHDGVDCYKGHNNEEFEQILRKVLEHKDQKIIDEGYRVVSERSIDKVGTKIKDVYQEILSNKK